MTNACKVSIFRDEQGQILEFPPGLQIPFAELLMRKDGDKLILEPANPEDVPAWLAAFQDFGWKRNGHKGDK